MDNVHAESHLIEEHDAPEDEDASLLMDGTPERQLGLILETLHAPLLHGGTREVFLLTSFACLDKDSFTKACFLLVLSSCLLELLRLALWWVEERCVSAASNGAHHSCECKHCTSPIISLNGDRKNYNAIHEPQHTKIASSIIPYAIRIVDMAALGVLQLIVYFSATMFMLVAMTMNIYLIVSMTLGSGLGKVMAIGIKQVIIRRRK